MNAWADHGPFGVAYMGWEDAIVFSVMGIVLGLIVAAVVYLNRSKEGPPPKIESTAPISGTREAAMYCSCNQEPTPFEVKQGYCTTCGKLLG